MIAARARLLSRWLGLERAPRPLIIALAALLATSMIVAALAGSPGAAAAVLLTLGLALLAARWLADAGDVTWLVGVVGVALLVRQIGAALLHVWLVATGRGGALFLDDAGYLELAIAFAQRWQGAEIPIAADPSVNHPYVWSAAALLVLFGNEPLVVKVFNTFLGVLAAVLAYRTVRALDLPGARVTALILLVFPTLVLWSALALKDAFALAFALGAIWSVSEFVRSGRYRWFLVSFVSLLAIQDVRVYLFGILALAWPLALLISLRGRRRFVAAGLAAVVALPLVLTSSLPAYLGARMFDAAYIRAAMATGARTGYVEPLPVVLAAPGDRYVVTTAAEPECPLPGRTIEAPIGAQIVIEGQLPTHLSSPYVIVRRCDIVHIVSAVAVARPSPGAPLAEPTASPGEPTASPGEPTASPGEPTASPGEPTASPGEPTASPAEPTAPPAEPRRLTIARPEARNVIGLAVTGESEVTPVGRSLLANVAYLPTGLLFLFGAPFPFMAQSLADVALIPEMLLWYACVLLAALGLWAVVRERRWPFSYPLLVTGAVVLVLSLYEGNVGTLIRHRAMLIPFIVILAGIGVPEAVRMWSRLRARAATETPSG